MSIIIGIDVGGSTTKIVGFTADEPHNKQILSPIFVKASDPVASVYGAFGKFTSANGIALSDVKKVMITGVGSAFVDDRLYGIETRHLSEFECVGRGGLYVSGYENAIIVSMGTGTAIVHAKRGGIIEYMGGTGVGGGTLIGLSKKLFGISHVDNIVELAADGNIDNVDLRISDITNKDILPGLSSKLTASNFGKVSDVATRSDIALGLFNLIFESIGMLAIFAARARGLKDIVLTGNLAVVPQAKTTFDVLNRMFGMNFIMPENKQYATVIGTALKQFEKNGGGCL